MFSPRYVLNKLLDTIRRMANKETNKKESMAWKRVLLKEWPIIYWLSMLIWKWMYLILRNEFNCK